MGIRDNLPFFVRTITVSGPALPEMFGQSPFSFVRMEGTEHLCHLYQYDIELTAPRQGLQLSRSRILFKVGQTCQRFTPDRGGHNRSEADSRRRRKPHSPDSRITP